MTTLTTTHTVERIGDVIEVVVFDRRCTVQQANADAKSMFNGPVRVVMLNKTATRLADGRIAETRRYARADAHGVPILCSQGEQ